VFWFHIFFCFIVIFAIFPYFVAISVLFFALFLFYDNIIDPVPYSFILISLSLLQIEFYSKTNISSRLLMTIAKD
jgi:hypothetical protein